MGNYEFILIYLALGTSALIMADIDLDMLRSESGSCCLLIVIWPILITIGIKELTKEIRKRHKM